MPRTKTKSFCNRKYMHVLSYNNDSDSDTVDNVATVAQPVSEDVLSQETVEKKTRHAKQVMSADTEDTLIDWIRETPRLYRWI